MTRSFAKANFGITSELNCFADEINSASSEVKAVKDSRIEWLRIIRDWLCDVEFVLWDDDTAMGHNEGVYNSEWYSATAFAIVLNRLREKRSFSEELWLV